MFFGATPARSTAISANLTQFDFPAARAKSIDIAALPIAQLWLKRLNHGFDGEVLNISSRRHIISGKANMLYFTTVGGGGIQGK